MKVEQNETADDDPDVDKEVDAAADTDDFRKTSGMRRRPNEVKPYGSRYPAQQPYDRGLSIFDPCIKHDPQ
jgi:hypothetical protein